MKTQLLAFMAFLGIIGGEKFCVKIGWTGLCVLWTAHASGQVQKTNGAPVMLVRDTVYHGNIMTKRVADSAIAAILLNVSSKKSVSDSGRSGTNYATGYDLNKVKDSLQTNVNTNTTAIGVNTSAISSNTTAINLRKLITDSGRCVGCYATGYDLNKVKDSLQTNVTAAIAAIPTNNNQLTNGSAYYKPSDTGRSGANLVTGYDLNKVKDSLQANIATKFTTPSGTTNQYVRGDGTLATTSAGSVISITASSPLTGGTITTSGSIGIQDAAADGATKGAASFNADYFSASAGNISWLMASGTGTVSSGAVTINKPRGKITLSSPSVLAAANISITLTNSYITSTSTINVGVNGNGSNLTLGVNCYIKSQTSGSCVINLLNLSLLSTFTTSIIIDYMVVN